MFDNLWLLAQSLSDVKGKQDVDIIDNPAQAPLFYGMRFALCVSLGNNTAVLMNEKKEKIDLLGENRSYTEVILSPSGQPVITQYDEMFNILHEKIKSTMVAVKTSHYSFAITK